MVSVPEPALHTQRQTLGRVHVAGQGDGPGVGDPRVKVSLYQSVTLLGQSLPAVEGTQAPGPLSLRPQGVVIRVRGLHPANDG